jgi:putative selenium metabolism hydrolase
VNQTGRGFVIDEEGLTSFVLRLIGEQSPSGKEGGVAQLVAAELERLGFQVEVDELGNVTGTIEAGDGPCILIDSHMDTVGVTDPAAWSYSPEGQRVDGRIYGRGAMDMKGPLAASIYGAAAAKDLLRRGKTVVSATVAEEFVEGPALARVAERVNPAFVVICEATSLKLARGQRGRAEIRVEVFGRPTHSSRPELGVNAAQAMADIVRELRDLEPPPRHAIGGGILVLTDIISRPYPGLSVVPDYCVATFDRRTLPGETEEDVLGPVRRVIEYALSGSEAEAKVTIAEDDFESYTGERVRAPNFAPAWYFDDDAEVVRRALAGLERAGITSELTHYAFCTNGSGTAGRLGIPTIGFGPGEEELAHRIDEYIEVDQLTAAACGYAALAQQLTEKER